ncbi:hypothetical protein B5S33_g5186 [[Candida] boidinii]|nr:hypothetical protein B5S33_g5186 [[Candida] boidinii]
MSSSTDIELIHRDPRIIPQKRFFSFLLKKTQPPIPTQEERKPFPYSKSSWFNQSLFIWLLPLLFKGYKRRLVDEDLWYMDETDSVNYSYNTFIERFKLDVQNYKIKFLSKKLNKPITDITDYDLIELDKNLPEDFEYPNTLLFKTLVHVYGFEYATTILLRLFADLFTCFTPLLSKELIKFVEEKARFPNTSLGKGVGYAVGCSIFVFFRSFLLAHYFNAGGFFGIKMKNILIKAVYDKSFKLSRQSHHDYPPGKITSIMGTDLARFEISGTFFGNILVFPITLALTIILLCINIGAVGLIGIAVFILLFIFVIFISKFLMKYRILANKFTDNRVNSIKELLNNLKMIKYYTWEEPYLNLLKYLRENEMDLLFKMQSVRSLSLALCMNLPSISALVAFLCMYAIDGMKNPANVFTGLSFFNVLAAQSLIMPLAISTCIDGYIGLRRTQGFLLSSEEGDELNENDNDDDDEEEESGEERDSNSFIDKKSNGNDEIDQNSIAIQVVNGTFEWDKLSDEEEKENEKNKNKKPEGKKGKKKGFFKRDNSNKEEKKEKEENNQPDVAKNDNEATDNSIFNLHDINLSIKKGEFIAITGVIGSGKSSLLNALAKFMPIKKGSIYVNGSLLLCGFPWVQNTTIRDNILFGSDYDEEKYKRVIQVCALERDLTLFPFGDETEIGERGITLSGGQKARLNLARSVYADMDILLMDDVLSAVDARVGEHIMENCILGYLKDKTRILATHQLSLIGKADKVIFINVDGGISIGSIDELEETNEDFKRLIEYGGSHHNVDSEDGKAKEKGKAEEDEPSKHDAPTSNLDNDVAKGAILEKIKSEHNKKNEQVTKEFDSKYDDGFSLKVYTRFIGLSSKSPILAFSFLFFLFVIAIFSNIYATVVLSYWTGGTFGLSQATYQGLYSMFTFLGFFLLLITYVLMSFLMNTASSRISIMALQKILRTPISYLDVTPMGRILNRFTKDTDVIDNEVLDQLRWFLFATGNGVGILILCIVYIPWFAISLPFLIFLYFIFTDIYAASSNDIKKMEAAKRSMVFNGFGETLNGMATIKSYGENAINRFILKNVKSIDEMTEASMLSIANQRCLAVYLSFVGTFFMFVITMLCCAGIFNVSASDTGLLVSNVMSVTNVFSFIVRSATLIDNQMTSAERIEEYAFDLVEEAPVHTDYKIDKDNWPSNGEIEFKNVSMRYRPELPLSLLHLNLKINGNDKIGICGRTGAGKSTITSSLYRLVELSEGAIFIDGIDISKLGLFDLRSKLCIIPQDPILFNGTMRENLDPFKEKTDEELYMSLKRSGLIEFENDEQFRDIVTGKTSSKFSLNRKVEDGGENFSLGERQLVALARALVRQSKILILDEATSSVDYETDSKIQNTIAREFKDCTILCVAHRLKTILNYDKILVMEKGEAVEYDSPLNLYSNQNSIFRDMCNKSGIKESDFL